MSDSKTPPTRAHVQKDNSFTQWYEVEARLRIA
jgi:hypothetical protein